MPIVYAGLGSNLGDRADNIRRAMDMLKQADKLLPLEKGAGGIFLNVLAVSSLYETEPEHYELALEQNWFVNAAARIETDIFPQELLKLFKDVERAIGRKNSVRWGPREIDLDILLYDQICFENTNITIPHPRMHQRAFVLVPLAEIAANVPHPVLGKTVGTLLAELQTPKIVRRLETRETRHCERLVIGSSGTAYRVPSKRNRFKI